MKLFLPPAFAVALSLGSPAVDRPLIWSSVSITSQHEDEEVRVSVEGGDKLTRVVLKLGELELEVPAEELERFDQPRLEKFTVLSGAEYYGPIKEDEEPIPHLLIEVPYGERSAFGEFGTVRFLFHSGHYQELIISTQTEINTWKHQRKVPDGDLRDAGTSTKLPNP